MQKKYVIADRKLLETQDPSAPITIFVNPTQEEKKYLIEQVKIDEHNITSSLDPDELSRLELDQNHTALIFKRPKNYSGADQFLFKVASAGIFILKDQLVIIVSEDVPLLDGMQMTRVLSLRDLVLKLILRAIVHFREHLRIISTISDELQGEINTAMENRHLIDMFTLEKSLVYYLNFIHSNGGLIEKLRLNAAKMGFDAEEIEILDDILIENTQCYKQAEIYSNILASLMDARASIVGNNLNVLMKTLNIIVIILMVPTLVVSIFSMNVAIPLAKQQHGFWMIMALAALSSASVLFLWRYKKW